ncbi:MAG: DUF3488 domain-containing transglutaminase family protein [Bdellovibrionaceae bacterium]|nr:DUF3488 domain-containing transglutaminase family protein [Pseudobdellovibrionaceae bacterium]
MINTWRFVIATTILVIMVGLEVQPSIMIAGIALIVWKSAIEFWHLAKPSRWVTNTLTVIALLVIILKYRTLMSQEASGGFLILLTTLKLLEERTPRDQKFLFLLGFVLISSLLLFSLELPSLVAGLISFYLLWTAQNKNVSYRNSIFKAAPIALILFLFFPRVQNPFGIQGVSSGNQAQTGFSDELNPGSIAKIQSTKELVFRVQFLTPNLKPRTLEQYWKGQVLNLSEGLRWTQGPRMQRDLKFEKIASPDYEVTLEPHNRRWIFIFDPTEMIYANDFGFVHKAQTYFESVAPIRERLVYRGKVATTANVNGDSALDLQTPELSEKVRELASAIARKGQSRTGIAEAWLDYLRAEKFLYSKSPGTGSGTVDAFLFGGKKGYCEHFAATTAIILRLAKVPARVVIGYQGGEYNGYGNFWRFTQADAHAWVEYKNDQDDWTRMDPTSVVAPERLELGGLLFEDLPEEWIGQNRAGEFLKSRESWWIQSRDFITMTADSWNYDLVVFLLDFNLEKQKQLIGEYGYALVGLILLLLSPFVIQSFLRRRRPTTSEWLLRELDRRAEKRKLHRQTSETMRQFVARWQAMVPENSDSLIKLLSAYEAAEYHPAQPPANRSELRQLLREL